MLRKLATYKKDLQCCGQKELTYRLLDVILSKPGIREKQFPAGWMTDNEVFEAFENRLASKEDLCEYIRERSCPVFPFKHRSRLQYQGILNKEFATEKEELVRCADRCINNRFRLLGKTINFGNGINWHFSENPSKDWPRVHWSRLNITDKDFGDIKPVWELNRLQHFFLLGRAYWWTGDEKYVDAFQMQLRSWLEANPPELGINWQSNLEIALRSISLIWAVQFFLDQMDDDTLFDVVRVLIHSARHIDKHLPYSEYCMRNNHLIGDAAGLAVTAIWLQELKEAAAWKRKALDILFREVEAQVFDDGVSFEQSTSYHGFVFYLYLSALLLHRLNGGDISGRIMARLEKMIDFVRWVIKPDGSTPRIGDGDDASVLPLSNAGASDLRPILQIGSYLFDRTEFKVPGQPSESVLWLFGPEALAALSATKSANEHEVRCLKTKSFTDGGFYIARDGWTSTSGLFLLRSGPFSKHHSHADQLHIELSAFGKDLLVDPGTFVYNGNPRWRDYFRGEAAHNTIAVAGVHQAVPHRSFRWTDICTVEDADTAFGNSVFWAQGGYTALNRQGKKITLRRGVLSAGPGYYFVIDDVLADGACSYETYYHFAMGGVAELVSETGECRFTRDDGGGLVIKPLEQRISARIVTGNESPQIQGWLSPRYGEVHSTPVLIYKGVQSGAGRIATVLQPFEASKSPASLIINGSAETGWTVGNGQYTDIIKYRSASSILLETDSAIAFCRVREGNVISLFLSQGSYANVGGVLEVTGSWNAIECRFIRDAGIVEVTGDVFHFALNGRQSTNLSVKYRG